LRAAAFALAATLAAAAFALAATLAACAPAPPAGADSGSLQPEAHSGFTAKRLWRGQHFAVAAANPLAAEAGYRMLEAGGSAELPRIVAFRNLLIHGYANVDDRLVWGVVKTKIPTLQAAVERLLTPDAD